LFTHEMGEGVFCILGMGTLGDGDGDRKTISSG
jgi:hypothetical protein